ncbi:hypothetical protein CDCA_CDCA10G2944 [Cyanidium caldarium]|uniref:Chorismate mutase n=1 Tax=Cyanidium caldarium TaxID=2771 RepID=A0AAV9IXA8_CYACA|nr:hypothetical protein CDCA_CDCA10G2944 [Cyanidium caldarium]
MFSALATLELDQLRSKLIRQEETIIFALIERAQFKTNRIIYRRDEHFFRIPNFEGSFLEYLLSETEKLHARVRRYTAPDEYAFFPEQLPAPILPPLQEERVLHPNDVNVNARILRLYIDHVVPRVTEAGDDKNYGSSAVNDVTCLQAISKRIHYGKFVAEAKFRADPELYTKLIRRQDRQAIEEQLTDREVEAQLLRRVEIKATTYGQEATARGYATLAASPNREADGDTGDECRRFARLLAQIYADWIIPLTKEVEVAYLLQRMS